MVPCTPKGPVSPPTRPDSYKIVVVLIRKGLFFCVLDRTSPEVRLSTRILGVAEKHNQASGQNRPIVESFLKRLGETFLHTEVSPRRLSDKGFHPAAGLMRTMRAVRAAGVMPEIRLACPRDRGRRRVSFSRSSRERPGTES